MIVQGQTTSFKEELYEAIHNFTTDTFKIALYTANATLNQNTTEYTDADEITGTGYTATVPVAVATQAPVVLVPRATASVAIVVAILTAAEPSKLTEPVTGPVY